MKDFAKKDRLLPMKLFHKREQGSFFVLYVGGSLDGTALTLFNVLQQLIQTLSLTSVLQCVSGESGKEARVIVQHLQRRTSFLSTPTTTRSQVVIQVCTRSMEYDASKADANIPENRRG